MSSIFPLFDTKRLDLRMLSARRHDLDLSVIKPLEPCETVHPHLEKVANRLIQARRNKAAVIFMMGAHVLRAGVQHYLIDMIQQGWITCIATNGACVIHDYEFALIGQTTESVARYIRTGQFGLWRETGYINTIVKHAAEERIGLGEAVGRAIAEGGFPMKDISLFATAFKQKRLMTVHVGIGYDIVHEHPNCDGGAYGQTSYTDFLRFTKALEALEGGVVMNFGSAVMAPEVFLKALAMVRNVAAQENRTVCHFTTLVCDLHPLPENIHQEASKQSHDYYFRPWKTMLIRTVADGGESYYVRGNHRQTIPQLWTALQRQRKVR